MEKAGSARAFQGAAAAVNQTRAAARRERKRAPLTLHGSGDGERERECVDGHAPTPTLPHPFARVTR
jgi:hypothetical protein